MGQLMISLMGLELFGDSKDPESAKEVWPQSLPHAKRELFSASELSRTKPWAVLGRSNKEEKR